jgi:transposase
MMLSFSGDVRVFMYQDYVDMRKGFEGLSALVESSFDIDICSGAYFAFLNRKQDRMKVLYWDADGLALWYKRLEKGTFSTENKKIILDRREFLMILEGVIPKRLKKRYKHV